MFKLCRRMMVKQDYLPATMKIDVWQKDMQDEDRFLMLGMSSGARLLLVCHCEREEGNVIRIISARTATRRESTFYTGGRL